MAEGGDFGIDQPELDKTLDNKDDDDDEQEVNNTDTFDPYFASTPGHGDDDGEQYEMQTRQHEQSRIPETSFDEDIPLLGGRTQSVQERAWGALKGLFPKCSSTRLEASYSLKGRLQVKMAGAGKKLYDLFTTKRGTGEQQLNPNLSKEIRRELGPMAQDVIERDNEEIRNDRRRLREAEKELRDAEKLASERQKTTQKVQNLNRKNSSSDRNNS